MHIYIKVHFSFLGVPPAFLFAIAFTSLVCKQTFTLEYKLNILFFFEKGGG